MSLSWEQTKSLMRLQAVAQELVTLPLVELRTSAVLSGLPLLGIELTH